MGSRLRTAIGRAGLAALLALCLLAGCALPSGTVERLPTVGPVPTPTPLPPIRLPDDEAAHQSYNEWWYYTGHLAGVDASGRERAYSFELTFFQTRRGRLPPYYAAHFAIGDPSAGRFAYDERSGFVPSGELASDREPGFDLSLDDWRMRGRGGRDHLQARMADYAIDLSLVDELPRAILHAGDGVISYGDAGYSYYYSRPRLRVAGTLEAHGVKVAVTGQAWMDHQWGDFVTLAGTGWDWFSLQLDDGAEYMLYVIRDREQRPLSVVGTAVEPDGSSVEMPAEAIRIAATGAWASPRSGGTYPSGWQVDLPTRGLSLTLTPTLLDQELVTARSTGVTYWEGAVRVRGRSGDRPIAGKGFVELTGYAAPPAVPPELSWR